MSGEGKARGWRAVLAVTTMAVVCGGAIVGWRWWKFPERVRVALPVAPELSGKPVELRNAFVAAQAKTQSRREVLVGVAELGRLYHVNGYLAQAETCWRLLHEQQPREGRWWYYLADARRASSDYAAVESLLQQTIARAPEYSPAWLQLAALEFKSGNLEAAENHYRRRLALVPGDPHARLGLARIALQRGQRVEARRELEQIAKDTPDFPPAQNLLAELLAADGETVRARDHRWRGREAGRFKEPEDPWLSELIAWCYDADRLCVLGTMEYQTQRHAQARALLERAKALAPSDAAIRTLLGELYLKMGEAARAKEILEPMQRDAGAMKIKLPVGFYVTLSEAHHALGTVDEALRVLNVGLGAYPDSAELLHQRGAILLGASRVEQAAAAFREAVRCNPNHADAAFNLGMLLLAARQHDEAIGWLRRAIAAQPTHPQALTLLARIEMEAGRLDQAWAYLEPLFENNSGVPQVRQLVGRWQWQAGNLVEKQDAARAENYYRGGIEVSPDDPELQASLGVLLLTRGRFSDALAPLEAYHRLQPENARSALFLGQVYASLRRIDEARRVLTQGEQIATRAGQKATAEFCREILRQL